MPRGGGKMPGLTPSINQHVKKKLDSFKDLKRKLPRMFGPKGFDPNIFASTLAGFAAPINIRGQECYLFLLLILRFVNYLFYF